MVTTGIMQLSSAKLKGSVSQRTQQVYAVLECQQAAEKHVYFPAYNIIPQLQCRKIKFTKYIQLDQVKAEKQQNKTA